MWTKESIQHLLNTNDLAVERAIVAIYDRQTRDEKAEAQTKHHNAVGFRKNHDHTGSFFACIILKGWKQPDGKKRTHLNPVKLEKARKIALQYHRQLCEIANAKETKKMSNNKRPSMEEINRQEEERERRKANFVGNDEEPDSARDEILHDELMMQRMEAEGDRAQTLREERAKHEFKQRVEGPIPGTYAYTARILADLGIMSGEEADDWKDRMKDGME